MKYYTYLIGSKKPFYKTYVGWTNNIKKRVTKHNSGTGAKSTRGRKWILLYKEVFSDKKSAMKREYYIKKNYKLRNKIKKRYENLFC